MSQVCYCRWAGMRWDEWGGGGITEIGKAKPTTEARRRGEQPRLGRQKSLNLRQSGMRWDERGGGARDGFANLGRSTSGYTGRSR
jgi:hypothetical protein